jgi:hypothetical protein
MNTRANSADNWQRKKGQSHACLAHCFAQSEVKNTSRTERSGITGGVSKQAYACLAHCFSQLKNGYKNQEHKTKRKS